MRFDQKLMKANAGCAAVMKEPLPVQPQAQRKARGDPSMNENFSTCVLCNMVDVVVQTGEEGFVTLCNLVVHLHLQGCPNLKALILHLTKSIGQPSYLELLAASESSPFQPLIVL